MHLERFSGGTDVMAVGAGETRREHMPRLNVFAHDGLVGGDVEAGGAAEARLHPEVHLLDQAVQLGQVCKTTQAAIFFNHLGMITTTMLELSFPRRFFKLLMNLLII